MWTYLESTLAKSEQFVCVYECAFTILYLYRFDSEGVATVLDDKSHLKATRERYRVYEIETPWDYVSEEKAGELEACGDTDAAVSATFPGKSTFDLLYDDEYDDTYDSQNVGAADDATDEMFTVRR